MVASLLGQGGNPLPYLLSCVGRGPSTSLSFGQDLSGRGRFQGSSGQGGKGQEGIVVGEMGMDLSPSFLGGVFHVWGGPIHLDGGGQQVPVGFGHW